MNRALRLALLRWHRRVGVVVALLVVLLVITGIALNHSAELGLGKRALRSPALLSLYGVELPEIAAYPLGGQWLSHVGGSHLYLDEREVAYCQQPMAGAVLHAEVIAALCDGQLLLLGRDGEVIERIGSVYGLPPGVEAIARDEAGVLLRSAEAVYRADLESLLFSPAETSADDWAQSQPPPAALRRQLLQSHVGDAIDWERLLLDLHSGRLFGRAGVWLMDAAALCLLLLALSGAWVWLTKPGRFKRR